MRRPSLLEEEKVTMTKTSDYQQYYYDCLKAHVHVNKQYIVYIFSKSSNGVGLC